MDEKFFYHILRGLYHANTLSELVDEIEKDPYQYPRQITHREAVKAVHHIARYIWTGRASRDACEEADRKLLANAR